MHPMGHVSHRISDYSELTMAASWGGGYEIAANPLLLWPCFPRCDLQWGCQGPLFQWLFMIRVLCTHPFCLSMGALSCGRPVHQRIFENVRSMSGVNTGKHNHTS